MYGGAARRNYFPYILLLLKAVAFVEYKTPLRAFRLLQAAVNAREREVPFHLRDSSRDRVGDKRSYDAAVGSHKRAVDEQVILARHQVGDCL